MQLSQITEKNACWVEMNGSRNHVALTGPGPFKAIGIVIEQNCQKGTFFNTAVFRPQLYETPW